jgi:hypothetical protein
MSVVNLNNKFAAMIAILVAIFASNELAFAQDGQSAISITDSMRVVAGPGKDYATFKSEYNSCERTDAANGPHFVAACMKLKGNSIQFSNGAALPATAGESRAEMNRSTSSRSVANAANQPVDPAGGGHSPSVRIPASGHSYCVPKNTKTDADWKGNAIVPVITEFSYSVADKKVDFSEIHTNGATNFVNSFMNALSQTEYADGITVSFSSHVGMVQKVEFHDGKVFYESRLIGQDSCNQFAFHGCMTGRGSFDVSESILEMGNETLLCSRTKEAAIQRVQGK